MVERYYHGTGLPLLVLRDGIRPANEQDEYPGKSFDNSDGSKVYLADTENREIAEECGCVIEVTLTDEQVSALEPDPDSTGGWMYEGHIPPEQLSLSGDEFARWTEFTGNPMFPAGVEGIARDCDSIEELMDEMADRRPM